MNSEKQDRLLQFVNEDLAEEKKMETEANNLYTQVLVDDSQYDEAMTQEANTIFEEANAIYDKDKKEITRLGEEYEVTFED